MTWDVRSQLKLMGNAVGDQLHALASAQGSHAGSRHLHLCLRPDIVSAPHEHVP